MHDPECHCDSAEAVSTVAAEVARLTAERDALAARCKRKEALCDQWAKDAEKAEAERDALRAAITTLRAFYDIEKKPSGYDNQRIIALLDEALNSSMSRDKTAV